MIDDDENIIDNTVRGFGNISTILLQCMVLPELEVLREAFMAFMRGFTRFL